MGELYSRNIEIDSLQEYFKLYSTSKQISVKLYLMYFAFAMEISNKNQSTADVIKLKPSSKVVSTP